MAVFYILFLVPVMLQHFSVKRNELLYEKKNKWALLFFFVFLTVLIMLRHETIGKDTQNYIYKFNIFANPISKELCPILSHSEFAKILNLYI